MKSFIKKTRNEMIRYSRPNISSYVNSDGVINKSPPNVMRFEYDKWGYYLGLKFGDGDTATIPVNNNFWNQEGGTIVVIGRAPQGVTWFKFGDTEINGIDAHKLYIIELTKLQASTTDTIQLFPNKEDVPEGCHFLLVKYYHQNNIDFGEDKEVMDEFNTFMHQDWR